MQALAYELMAGLEADHWWYRGRRAVIRALLAELELPARARLLDLGCGTGGNLRLLGERGSVFGVEPAPEGLRLATRVAPGRIARGLADRLPFVDASFDAIAALDVLEHLHDELQVLAEVRRVLRPGGYLLLYVPAYAALWGHEDVVSHHLRRYRASQIRRLLEAARLEIVRLGYSNLLLFPLIASIKVAKRLAFRGELRPDVSGLPPLWLNDVLSVIFESEAEVAAGADLPFGASVLGLARKP